MTATDSGNERNSNQSCQIELSLSRLQHSHGQWSEEGSQGSCLLQGLQEPKIKWKVFVLPLSQFLKYISLSTVQTG
jgi:hypothetical protein